MANFELTPEGKLKKVSEVTTTTQEVVYSYDELIRQRQAIQDQKDRDNTQRDAELAEVNNLIAKYQELIASQ